MLNNICITIDIDPDGLSGKYINRNTLSFEAFNKIKDNFSEGIENKIKTNIPITWFVRIDDQIKIKKDNYLYLIEENKKFWESAINRNHEIAWHPHLYKIIDGVVLDILTDNNEIEDTIKVIWQKIKSYNIKIETFRNGEGWMTTNLLNLLEDLDIQTDSTAIAGRNHKEIASKDWTNIPNHYYYPDFNNCKQKGSERRIIELPMNSWKFKTSYDAITKLRYINPAVHKHYFIQGLNHINQHWTDYRNTDTWVFITHPDEIADSDKQDLLYANSMNIYAENILLFQKFLEQKQISVKYSTIYEATKRYRGN